MAGSNIETAQNGLFLDDFEDGFAFCADVELLVDAVNVCADGVRTYEQTLSDLFIPEPVRKISEDFAFARR